MQKSCAVAARRRFARRRSTRGPGAFAALTGPYIARRFGLQTAYDDASRRGRSHGVSGSSRASSDRQRRASPQDTSARRAGRSSWSLAAVASLALALVRCAAALRERGPIMRLENHSTRAVSHVEQRPCLYSQFVAVPESSIPRGGVLEIALNKYPGCRRFRVIAFDQSVVGQQREVDSEVGVDWRIQ